MAIYSDPPTANNFDPPHGAFRAIWPYPSRRFCDCRREALLKEWVVIHKIKALHNEGAGLSIR